MNRFDHIVLGGNIASLVTARELVRKGASVALFSPPGMVGGHFSSHSALGFEFDLGMTLLELDSYHNQETDLSGYDPSVLGSAGKFTAFVEKVLNEYFEFREVVQIQVATDNGLIDDYYISNELKGIPEVFSDAERKLILDELARCAASEACHPRGKASAAVFDGLNYEQASIENHGELIHRTLIEPLVARATNLQSDRLHARNHRLFWSPLFYPETLLGAFNGEPTIRATRFHHPVACGVGSLSRQLMAELEASGCIVVPELSTLQAKGAGWVVNDSFRSDNLSSSLPQQLLAQLAGIEATPLQKSSYPMVFLKLQGKVDCEVIFNASGAGLFFRLVNQSRLRGDESTTFLTVEYNLDLVCRNNEDFVRDKQYLAEIKAFIEHLSLGECVVLDSSIVELKNKIVFPDLGNVRLNADNTELFEGVPIMLMGPSLGMNGGALNDQILQALRHVEMSG